MRARLQPARAAVLAGFCWAGALDARAETLAVESVGADKGGAQVVVIRAAEACFSSAVPVTGVIAARREAIVMLQPGDKVVDVSAREGDAVALDQTLAQASRPSREPPKPGVEAKPDTVALKAPAAGVIIRSTAAVGAIASPMQPEPLFRIAVDGELEIDALAPSVHAPELAPGQSARVLIRGMVERVGTVRLAPAVFDPKTQLGHARISIGRDPALRFATFAQAVIDARHSCGISVPRSAVTYKTEGVNVQIVNRDVVETRSVEIGLRSDTDAEVTKGLAVGDLVVANAGTSLRDGDKARPVEAPRASDQR